MHILITGGEGYIGNYLTEVLLEEGFFVTTLDSHFANKPYDFSKYPRNRLRRFQASVVNPDVTIRAMQGVDIIYHLAARMDYNQSYRHPIRMAQSNIQGTCNLLCMANRAGINRIIFSSSAAIYSSVPAKETDSPMPVNMYGASKLAAEALCRGFYHKGMEIVILRFFNVWGRRNSQSIVNKFANGNNTIFSDGFQTRDFVYIGDVLKALRSSIDWESAIYNIGTGEEITIEGLYKILNPDKEPKYKDFQSGWSEPYRSCADTEFTEKNTGWKAQTLISDLDKERIIKLCNLP